MKFFFVKFFFIFLFAGISNANENIKFININYIVNNSEAGKTLNKIIENKSKKITSELNNMGKKIENKKDKIISQKNKGSASATNVGIRASNMKYIKFLDADDLIINKTTLILLKLLEKNIWDEKLLRELVDTMSEASICGLGQAAGNPITCSLNYFKDRI